MEVSAMSKSTVLINDTRAMSKGQAKKAGFTSEEDVSDWITNTRREDEYSVRIMQSFRSFGAGYPEIQCNDSGCRCIPL